MQFNMQGTTDSIALENLVISLDDTLIKGFTRVKQFKNPAIAFNLAIDTIDVDRYTAPKQAGTAPASGATPATAVAAATTLIPMETIRGLNITGMIPLLIVAVPCKTENKVCSFA
jgi:AsmA protein